MQRIFLGVIDADPSTPYRDPIITRRVRRLMLFLHLEEQTVHSRWRYEGPLPHVCGQIFHAIKNPFRKPTTLRKIKAFDDVLGTIMYLSPNLRALQELKVDCWNLPSSVQLSEFLISLWVPISENLRILSFGGNLHQYRTLVDSKPAFPALKELQMDFNSRGRVTQQFRSADIITLEEVVLPFVQTLKPQLEVLQVSSSSTLDFSAFFRQLGPFPALEVLDDRMHHHNFNRPDLTEILQRSRTFKHPKLQMIPNDCLTQSFADSQCLSHLRILTIQHPGTPLKVIRLLIRRGSTTLEEVCLGDRYLQISEAKTTIEALALCPNLISLKIRTIRITVQLFALLAWYLPHLRRLSISFQERFHPSGHYEVSSRPLFRLSTSTCSCFLPIPSFRASRNALTPNLGP